MSLFAQLSRSFSSLANFTATPVVEPLPPTNFVNTLDITDSAFSCVSTYDGSIEKIGNFRSQVLAALSKLDVVIRQHRLTITWELVFNVILSRLEGNALLWTQCSPVQTPFTDVHDFLTRFLKNFGYDIFISNLYTQWTEPSYYRGKTTGQILSDLQITGLLLDSLSDQTIIFKSLSLLPPQLTEKIKDDGIHLKPDQSLTEYIALVTNLAHNRNLYNHVQFPNSLQTQKKYAPKTLSNYTPATNYPPLSNYQPTKNFLPPAHYPPPNVSGPTPMIFEVRKEYSGPIHGVPLRDNDDLRQYLRENGLCFYCRSSTDHSAPSCPQRANKPATNNYPKFLNTIIFINHVPITAMVDTGAIGANYMHPRTAKLLNLNPILYQQVRHATSVDLKPIPITHHTGPIQCTINGTATKISFDILEIAKFDIILGLHWVQAVQPTINWQTLSIKTTPSALAHAATMSSSTRANYSINSIALTPSEDQQTTPPDSAVVPEAYKEYSHLFKNAAAAALPPHRPGFDFEIKLQDNTHPPFGRIYPLAVQDAAYLRTHLADIQKRQYIRKSSLPAGAPVLFVKKKTAVRVGFAHGHRLPWIK